LINQLAFAFDNVLHESVKLITDTSLFSLSCGASTRTSIIQKTKTNSCSSDSSTTLPVVYTSGLSSNGSCVNFNPNRPLSIYVEVVKLTGSDVFTESEIKFQTFFLMWGTGTVGLSQATEVTCHNLAQAFSRKNQRSELEYRQQKADLVNNFQSDYDVAKKKSPTALPLGGMKALVSDIFLGKVLLWITREDDKFAFELLFFQSWVDRLNFQRKQRAKKTSTPAETSAETSKCLMEIQEYYSRTFVGGMLKVFSESENYSPQATSATSLLSDLKNEHLKRFVISFNISFRSNTSDLASLVLGEKMNKQLSVEIAAHVI